MVDVSRRTIKEIGKKYDITIKESELDEILEKVNNTVEKAQEIEDFPFNENEGGNWDRSWSSKNENFRDRHNSIITHCEVPPTNNQGPLVGITVGVKDNIPVAGIPMTMGSRMMEDFIPEYDAEVVKRIRASGGEITAKTNCDEFASSGGGRKALGGPITNPHNPSRMVGGSSGGSAVAVLNGYVDVALGTDTVGSIRQPASHCGVIGLKPSWGLVPTAGFVENSYTRDHIGPLTRTVEDAACVLEAVSGPCHYDPGSLQASGKDDYRVGNFKASVRDPPDINNITIGLVEQSIDNEDTESIVTDKIYDIKDKLETAGATVREASLLLCYKYSEEIQKATTTEAGAWWKAGGVPYRRGGIIDESFPMEFKKRLKLKSQFLNTKLKAKYIAANYLSDITHGYHYVIAERARQKIRDEIDETLENVDVLASPTMPTLSQSIDKPKASDHTRNVRIANITHHPAISIPGETINNLPIGFQLTGNAYCDDTLLGIAKTVHNRI